MNEAHLKELREEFQNLSDEELISKMREGTNTQRIAAEQLFTEHQAQINESRHKEAVAESHKSNRLAIIAIGIAALSLIVSILAIWRSWAQ